MASAPWRRNAKPRSFARWRRSPRAADRFGVTRRWLLDHADQIPGVKRLSRKVVRFSEQHLEGFLARAGI